jgi:hypothetical protein
MQQDRLNRICRPAGFAEFFNIGETRVYDVRTVGW